MSHLAKLKEVKDAFQAPVTQVERNIAHAFKSMQREMSNFFSRYLDQFDLIDMDLENLLPDVPAVDIIETDKSFKVTMDLPGIEPKDIDVNAADGYLTVKGERKEDKKEDTATYHRREVSQGEFERTLTLPASADWANAEATLKNGLLMVSMPKKADAHPKAKKIEIKKAA